MDTLITENVDSRIKMDSLRTILRIFLFWTYKMTRSVLIRVPNYRSRWSWYARDVMNSWRFWNFCSDVGRKLLFFNENIILSVCCEFFFQWSHFVFIMIMFFWFFVVDQIWFFFYQFLNFLDVCVGCWGFSCITQKICFTVGTYFFE